MTVTVVNGNYVVEIPEQSIHQSFNPDVNPARPFASQAEAQAWNDTVLASFSQAQAAYTAAVATATNARLAAEVYIEIVAASVSVAVGAPVAITATLKDGLGAVAPLTATFAVPIENSSGQVEMIKSIIFTAGLASVSITFTRSGYYRITEAGINRKLPPAQHMRLAAPFEVTVFE